MHGIDTSGEEKSRGEELLDGVSGASADELPCDEELLLLEEELLLLEELLSLDEELSSGKQLLSLD